MPLLVDFGPHWFAIFVYCFGLLNASCCIVCTGRSCHRSDFWRKATILAKDSFLIYGQKLDRRRGCGRRALLIRKETALWRNCSCRRDNRCSFWCRSWGYRLSYLLWWSCREDRLVGFTWRHQRGWALVETGLTEFRMYLHLIRLKVSL